MRQLQLKQLMGAANMQTVSTSYGVVRSVVRRVLRFRMANSSQELLDLFEDRYGATEDLPEAKGPHTRGSASGSVKSPQSSAPT